MKFKSGFVADYFEITALNMVIEYSAYLNSNGRINNTYPGLHFMFYLYILLECIIVN